MVEDLRLLVFDGFGCRPICRPGSERVGAKSSGNPAPNFGRSINVPGLYINSVVHQSPRFRRHSLGPFAVYEDRVCAPG